ncbi:MAG: hypothetical protein KDD69_11175 [Bdellovibrionales bacterium]|nr:hypothetical protein [Bdellovibrionales bacterium]
MKKALIFGEILYDCLPDGSEVLGGAPFNVAWHLFAFRRAAGGRAAARVAQANSEAVSAANAVDSVLLSRLGEDERGARARQAMADWGIADIAVEADAMHPTGIAQVGLHDGHPTFDLRPEQAYDYIEGTAVDALSDLREALLYHGSLALRNEVSRQTLQRLQEQFQMPCFVDLNLREPWWRAETLPQYLIGAKWLKVNDDELRILCGSSEPLDHFDHQVEAAQSVVERFQLEQLIVTLGSKGAFVVLANGAVVSEQTPPLETVVDTVGAGDAFTSVWLFGLLCDWSPQTALPRALRFAADICTIPGATSTDVSIYERQVSSWSN